MTDHQRELDRYRAGNVECAELVMRDPDKYPAIMQAWARAVLSKPATAPKAGPLFTEDKDAEFRL
jgi:hypothetical protein